MSLLTGWVDDARRSYCAYGADLIRTGCLLLRTTPSVAYRAAVLFQRFQAVAEEVRRKRGDYQQENGNREIRDEGETAISVSSLDVELKKSYIVPAHVGTERASGVLVLGDVYAPLDYCLFNLRKHDDILYLAAACVLVAAKIEDPSTHISHIIRIFMRLNQRRRGEPVIELLQPSQERCNDFKECVLEAEGILLPALGFQTFVECPFKYAIIFLGMMINDDNDNNKGNGNGDATVNKDFSTASGKLSSLNGVFANIALKKWLADAVCWLNDIPRSVELYTEEAYVLALCALFSTRPPNITGLPEEWIMAFGVDKTKLNAVLRVHRNYLEEALSSENDNIDLLIAARCTEPCYPIASKNSTATTTTTTATTGTGATITATRTSAATATAATTKGIEVSGNYDTVGNIPTIDNNSNNNPNVPVSLQQSNKVDSNPTLPSSIPTLSASNAPLGVPPMMASLGRLEALQSTLNLNLLMGGNLALPTNTDGNSNNDNNPHNSHTTHNSKINTSVGMGLSILGDGQSKGGVLVASGTAPVIAERPIEEEFHFEDLREVQRRRRQEEEERRAKRRRSSSKHRRRRHSDDRRRRRSSSRRRDDSRGGRKRPHSQSKHKSHRTEQQQQQQPQQHSNSASQHSRDERQRNVDRHRNDDRHRHDGRRRHDERPRQDARQSKSGKQRRQK
ncbi:hypothetical protein LSM04_004818 [Trypanosoma melophagium]|uniref:uncharacterized protein n=1 Tax=Trypanosoma melophagium TaxID=715481 RepID=UPI00351A82C4|nr:hypothetical protein LSM04_004818 [Trypanosoma melophagium]